MNLFETWRRRLERLKEEAGGASALQPTLSSEYGSKMGGMEWTNATGAWTNATFHDLRVSSEDLETPAPDERA
jgi:hypothetical protein